MTTPDNHKKYEVALAAEKERLIAEIKEHETPKNFGDDIDDIDSTEADEAEDQANQLSIAQALRDRVSEIDEILFAIQSGKPISEERLAKYSGLLAPEERG